MTTRHFEWVLAASLLLGLHCDVQPGLDGPAGPQGPQGPQGTMGAMGIPGPASPSLPDCPDDYIKDTSSIGITVCSRNGDEIVKVGTGRSAFWIDRYEASLWSNPSGTGNRYGASGYDYPSGFAQNGQITTVIFALSRKAVLPSGSLTWFQANEACRASGKRLPRSDEWLAAARGTIDPGISNGTAGTCVTQASGPRVTGNAQQCVSAWGAEDMVGNLDEPMSEWLAGLGGTGIASSPWTLGPGYGPDQTFNIASSAGIGNTPVAGLPAEILRGGHYFSGTGAGIYHMAADIGPSSYNAAFGVRCVIPR